MFRSTRSNQTIDPSKAILKGLSDDGGLYVFKSFNSSFYHKEMIELTYQELCVEVFKEVLTDYRESQIKDIVNQSYNKDKFLGNIVDVVPFKNHAYLNLYNGNTFAFKDLALSCLPNLLKTAKSINHITKKTVILTATSGDTGSATLEGFKNAEDVTVIVLYPADGISEFQELQMTKYQSHRVHVIPVIGNFDDCQRAVKELFLTMHPKHVNLSSANSINIGRIIPQIIYYFYAYLELVRKKEISDGELINITVPTGNFGNIYAAYVAKKMGVPIKKLIVASNQNNVLTDVFNHTVYQTNRALHQTISPSMDILVSSNLERYLFDVFKNDEKQLNRNMNQLKETKRITIEALKTSTVFNAYFATEKETKDTIKSVFETNHYLIDPHTAVGKHCANQYIQETNDHTYMLIVSTANPYKFSDAVIEALGLTNTEDLRSKFKTIETFTNAKIDNRMLAVLNVFNKSKPQSIQTAKETIKQIVGELDVAS